MALPRGHSFLSKLPKDFTVPIVVVQHLPRFYTKYLATSLNSFGKINVREVENGEKLEAGAVYIAPGGYQCEISQSASNIVASVHRGPRENNMRPSIDLLFRSAAKIYGNNTLGVYLAVVVAMGWRVLKKKTLRTDYCSGSPIFYCSRPTIIGYFGGIF